MAHSKYALLIRLADDRQQAAGERMKQAQGRLNDARSSLEQLDAFRAEYQQRLTQGGMKGMSISQWQDFQKFLLRLNDAVTVQQGEVERCIQRFMLEQQSWQNEYKKLKAYEKLLKREQQRASIKTARLQQKNSDEFATRQFWNRQHQDE